MMDRKHIKFDLYLVTDRKGRSEAQFFDIIIKAIKGGVTLIQLREKNTPIREFVNIGKKLKLILSPFKIPLIVNDRVDVALAIGAEGVHLGQNDMLPRDAREILGPHALIGLSIETVEQIYEANNSPIDYIAVSPVFSSSTKKDTAPPLGLEGVKQLKKLSHYPLIGIGGINLGNALSLKRAGADGAAVISAIFNASNSLIAARQFREIWL